MYLRAFITTLTVAILLPALLVLVADPYQVWHSSGFSFGSKEQLYSTNQRYQNAGLIRRFLECDECSEAAVIVGTSVSENTTTDDLRDVTGLDNTVRLIAKGSYPLEHWYMLQRALASGNVSVLFWEIYRNYASPDFDQFPDYGGFPQYLYTTTWTDDYSYLFNNSVVVSSLKLLTGTLDWTPDLRDLNSWHGEAIEKNFYQQWNDAEQLALLDSLSDPRIAKWQGSRPDWSTPAPAFEKFIEPLVDAYPEVEFVFFAPPVSLARRGEDLEGRLSGELVLRKKLARMADARNNVSLYAFDMYLPLVSDMKYYKDSGHFTAAVNSWMLERMAAGDPRFVLKETEVEAQGEKLWALAINYRPLSSCVDAPETCGVFNLD